MIHPSPEAELIWKVCEFVETSFLWDISRLDVLHEELCTSLLLTIFMQVLLSLSIKYVQKYDIFNFAACDNSILYKTLAFEQHCAFIV